MYIVVFAGRFWYGAIKVFMQSHGPTKSFTLKVLKCNYYIIPDNVVLGCSFTEVEL